MRFDPREAFKAWLFGDHRARRAEGLRSEIAVSKPVSPAASKARPVEPIAPRFGGARPGWRGLGGRP